MKGNETQSNTSGDDRTYEKVYERQRRRMRGLWFRDPTYYAQVDIGGRTKRIPLPDATTVAEAEKARQVLKQKIAAGEYPPKKLAPPADHSLAAAITGYQTTRDSLQQVAGYR